MLKKINPELDNRHNEADDIRSLAFTTTSSSVRSADSVHQAKKLEYNNEDDMKEQECEKEWSDTNSICSSAIPPVPEKVLYSEAPWNPIVVDGLRGPNTIGALQSFLQSRGEHRGEPVDGKFGPNTKKSLQKLMEGLGWYTGSIDGEFGKESVRAMQRWLTNEGFKSGKTGIDGIWGAHTTRQLQSFLNACCYAPQSHSIKPESSKPLNGRKTMPQKCLRDCTSDDVCRLLFHFREKLYPKDLEKATEQMEKIIGFFRSDGITGDDLSDPAVINNSFLKENYEISNSLVRKRLCDIIIMLR